MPFTRMISQIARGHFEQFDIFVDRYKPRLMAYMKSHVNDHHDAQDLVQEVFLRAFRAARQGALHESRGSLAPWIFTIAHHRMVDHVRKNISHPLRLLNDAALDSSHIKSPDRPLLHAELVDLIRTALDKLPLEQAQVLRLKVYGGLKIKEIADIQQCAVSTVKSRLCYGLGKLHDALSVTAGEDYERFLSL